MAARSIQTGRFVRTEQALEELAVNVIIPTIKEVLKEKDKVVSGRLRDSFDYALEGALLEIYSTEEYAGAIDVGRGGGKRPPQQNIIQWAKMRGIRPRYLGGKRQGKFMSLKTWSYYVANKIEREGYKGSDYLAESFIRFANIVESSVGSAMAEDIADTIVENIRQE